MVDHAHTHFFVLSRYNDRNHHDRAPRRALAHRRIDALHAVDERLFGARVVHVPGQVQAQRTAAALMAALMAALIPAQRSEFAQAPPQRRAAPVRIVRRVRRRAAVFARGAGGRRRQPARARVKGEIVQAERRLVRDDDRRVAGNGRPERGARGQRRGGRGAVRYYLLCILGRCCCGGGGGGVLLLFVILWVVRVRFPKAPEGLITGLFFALYAVLRILGEHYREPDAAMVGFLTKGQFFSLFMFLIAAGFFAHAWKRWKTES
jgi:hypothetical protein